MKKLTRSFLALPTRRALMLLLLPVTLLLTACSQERNEKLSVGTNIWPGYEAGYIAESEGLYKTGRVQMRQFSSATEVIRAFTNEVIQVAALTLDEALLLAQNDSEIIVFLVTDISDGADVIMAKPSINTLSDLKGKAVAVEGSALGAFVLSRALQLANLDQKDVNIKLMTVDESVAAYRSEDVDAVVTFEPFRSQLLRLGAGEVFTSKSIPNEIVDVLVSRRSIVDANEELVMDLAQGWLAGIKLIETQPQVSDPLIAKRLELDVSEVRSAFDGLILPDATLNLSMIGGERPSLVQVTESLAKVLKEKELLSGDISATSLFDSRFLPVP